MKELFTKVTKGTYPDIPKHFSRDLAKMVAACLNTNPRLRPSAAELLKMPGFGGGTSPAPSKLGHRRSNSHAETRDDEEHRIELLQTIKLPRNLK